MDVMIKFQYSFKMHIEQQPLRLPIDNNDSMVVTKQISRHGSLFPNTIRCIISGPSNCGKTNVVVTLLQHENGLRFENVYVYSKSLYQPKYQYLEQLLKPIKGIGYYPYNSSDCIIAPSNAKQNSIFIFDDVSCDKQSIIRDYFSMGRHNAIDSFYLCQTYSHIPKHLIRDNANVIVLFKQDELNLKHVFSDHVNTDMPFADFRRLCGTCWQEPYGFLVIAKDCDINDGRYRKGFDKYIYM